MSQVFVLQTCFRLCGRHFRTVDAICLLVVHFGSVYAFSLLLVMVSLGKRFRLCEWRFCFVKAFSPFQATLSLVYRVFARKTRFRQSERSFGSINAFSLGNRVYAFAYDVFERQFRSENAFSLLLATFSLGKSVIALPRVQFSPGYRVFAIWTRLRSLMCFRPVNVFLTL